MANKSYLGEVKFYLKDRNYGFLYNADKTKEVFFHVSGLVDLDIIPKAGDKVSYELMESKKGEKATNIKIIL